jgi:hypothetical protein
VTVGAYAFVTADWRELDYPLDLWLEWHLPVLDRVALVTYGEFDVPHSGDSRLIVSAMEINPVYGRYFNFYTIGKTQAQHLLDTDWKILLDIDEFIYRPNTDGLDPARTYGFRYHNLYGSIEYEMAPSVPFPAYQFRVHHGNRELLGDGANGQGPWADDIFFDVWHTGACRNPQALSVKWKAQIKREMAMGYGAHEGRLQYLDGPFPYEKYAEIWPGASIIRTNRYSMPEILVRHRERFNWWRP